MDTKATTVEDYILSFPTEVQERLQLLRQIIKENASEAMESISYRMPAYKLNTKPLVYFAGYSKHIGLYATPTGHEQFKNELSVYKQGKGSVQLPLSQPLPVDLIAKIVQFRVQENSK
jgi:uncharacterized protein YdhG (YjbR/CyaY superfamily)